MDQVNPNATFETDLFRRAEYANMCMKLINSHPEDHGACTIAVDAPWGVGKSTFLRMWINALNADNEALLALSNEERNGRTPILPIYYNAWENDFCDSALAPLLYSLCAMVEQTKDNGWILPENDELLTEFISSCGGLLTSMLYFHFSGDTTFAPSVGAVGQIATKGLLGLFKRYMQKDIEEPEPDSIGAAYDKQLEVREKFRKALSALAQQFGGVYIFIDELDRCKPTFAIETLEVIKHYFDIPGLTFIFGVDMVQLGHAIGGRYGHRMDTGGYLSKFFDHQVRLAMPTTMQMIERDIPKIPYYDRSILGPLTQVFNMCEVTPREVPGIIQKASTIWTIRFEHFREDETTVPYLLLVALLCMKVKKPAMYTSFLNGEFTRDSAKWQTDLLAILDSMALVSTYCRRSANTLSDECSRRYREMRRNGTAPLRMGIMKFCSELVDKASSDDLLRDKLHNLIELTC